MAKDYFYNKQKDAELESLRIEFSKLKTKEEQKKFVSKYTLERCYELLSFCRWKAAKLSVIKEDLFKKKEDLLKKNKQLKEENKQLKEDIKQRKNIIEILDLLAITSRKGEA